MTAPVPTIVHPDEYVIRATGSLARATAALDELGAVLRLAGAQASKSFVIWEWSRGSKRGTTKATRRQLKQVRLMLRSAKRHRQQQARPSRQLLHHGRKP